MKQYFDIDPWKVIETNFHSQFSTISESIFSIGNGRMGLRGNFEESFSGETLKGSYFAGVYYPDKTRVGWWKNGYPEYFAKVLNGVNWIGIDFQFDDVVLDLAKLPVSDFIRSVDMKSGVLSRKMRVEIRPGEFVRLHFKRCCSLADPDVGLVSVSISSENFTGNIKISPYLDFDVRNQDSNYDEMFWETEKDEVVDDLHFIQCKTRKTAFHVGSAMANRVSRNEEEFIAETGVSHSNLKTQRIYNLDITEGDTIQLEKYVINISSLYASPDEIQDKCLSKIEKIRKQKMTFLFEESAKAWADKWKYADVEIHGDDSAQQAIRFNIFQLLQTYTGDDARLNIGPKGFTGEKYGGSTYWDTEAYCIPFYLGTSDPIVARNLLKYRHNHLGKAIENGEKLGFTDGAALYPMVTMNGEECHNEWEITFEEIHRNGAIASAIYDYIEYTGDESYLLDGGIEVLIGIARFWSQRFNFSNVKNQYVMLGVTGPNEYENNVNNNWYTNYIARWCLQYTNQVIEQCLQESPQQTKKILHLTNLRGEERTNWMSIAGNVYLPEDKELGIFLQQEGYLDKEQILVADLPAKDRPLNQKWSWDRILRSCFIKQADVLQGIYFFEDDFTEEETKRNFDFYEPRTVHESSLSPCIHSILASGLGMKEKAYEMYLRTARLDLDDYNNDTEDGCHITSMAGTWLAIIKGFAGMRTRNGRLSFSPLLPDQWEEIVFQIRYRGNLLKISVAAQSLKIENRDGPKLDIWVQTKKHEIDKTQLKEISLSN